jgi:hypothetical protein
MEEEDHFTQTLLLALIAALAAAAMAARLLPLQLSLSLHSLAHTHVFSLHFALNKTCLFIGKYGQHGGASNALKCATNCGMNGATTNLVVGHCH